MSAQESGFREREHTADWELDVWAPDLPGLLTQAARGMYWLMGARLSDSNRQQRSLEFTGADDESRLVSFLQELLYLCDSEGLAFDQMEVAIDGDQGRAELSGAPLLRLGKEIKAVTYHNLAVRKTSAGLEATVVFDV
jgi:SHS2 domain-containing protein